MGALFGVIGFILFIGYGLAQLAIGSTWLVEHGMWWTIGVYILVFMFRFSLPMTICAFYGAMELFDWHWFWALMFAAPGIIFMFSGLIIAFLDDLRTKQKLKAYEEISKNNDK